MKRTLILAGLSGLVAACNPNVGRELFACTTNDDCTQGRQCKGGFCRGRGTDGTCLATTCAVEQATCGQLSDGCGQVLECGSCQPIAGGSSECVAGSCRSSCPTGARVCGGVCVVESPTSCGANCVACAVPTGGDAICTAGACGVRCPAGTRYCEAANRCVVESAESCGLGCVVCSAPPGQDAGAFCAGAGSVDGGSCDFTADLPIITSQPQPITIGEGEPLSLSVTATTSGTASYQWSRNSVAIPASSMPTARSATLQLLNASLATGGRYDVEVVNTVSFNGLTHEGSVRSSLVAVQVIGRPVIGTQPASGVFVAGSSATLTVVATGSGTLSYQWSKAGQPLPGKTSSSLTLASLGPSDVGEYAVEVTSTTFVPNQAPVITRTTSQPALVEVNQAPIIVTGPDGGTVLSGANVELRVEAVAPTAGATLGFDWFKNGSPFRLDAGSTITMPTVQKSDEGDYSVTVSSRYRTTITSAPPAVARLGVNQPPLIVTQPTSINSPAGASVGLSVNAISDAGVLAYQWLQNDAGLVGATQPTLSFSPLQGSHAGTYRVIVSNVLDGTVNAVQSNSATVVVGVQRPLITAPPEVLIGDAGVAFTQDQGGNVSYSWSIINGSFVGSSNTRSVTFTGAAVGPLHLGVVVSDAVSTADAGVVVTVRGAPNAWYGRMPMSTPRNRHTATLLQNGKVLVVGGFSGSTHLASAELFDPSTNSWSGAGALAAGRKGHSATLLNDGRVLVAGGDDGNTLRSSQVYDPGTNTWSSPVLMQNPHWYHAAVKLPNGRVLVVGGQINNSRTNLCDAYDPMTNGWSLANPLSVDRSDGVVALQPDGGVIAASGSSASALLSSEVYSPTSNGWSAGPSMSVVHRYVRDGYVAIGSELFVFGGQDFNNLIATSEKLGPTTNGWVTISSLSTLRRYHTASALPDRRVVIVGGGNLSDQPTSAVEVFDTVGGAMQPGRQSMAEARYWHTATVLSDGQVLVVGGVGAGGATLGTVELYSP